MDSNTQTLGESRVLVTYTDDNTETISKIRSISASLIDLLEEHKKSRGSVDGEEARLYANAMTEIEGACMWSIKAICK